MPRRLSSCVKTAERLEEPQDGMRHASKRQFRRKGLAEQVRQTAGESHANPARGFRRGQGVGSPCGAIPWRSALFFLHLHPSFAHLSPELLLLAEVVLRGGGAGIVAFGEDVSSSVPSGWMFSRGWLDSGSGTDSRKGQLVGDGDSRDGKGLLTRFVSV